MSKFRKNKAKENPVVSTASLPDIVFMLLFFFMVVTVIKNKDKLVQISLPHASEVKKLKNPKENTMIYVGKPIRQKEGTAPVIQMNDKFVSLERLQENLERHSIPEKRISMEVDKGVTMGVVTDVKLEIRKSNRLKVNYIALKERK